MADPKALLRVGCGAVQETEIAFTLPFRGVTQIIDAKTENTVPFFTKARGLAARLG